MQLSLSFPCLVTVFLDKIGNHLENCEYAFYKFHAVLTEFRGNIFSELSGESAGLKTSNPSPLKMQNENNIVCTVKTCSLTCLRERKGENLQEFFQFPTVHSSFFLFAVNIISSVFFLFRKC